MRKLNVSIVLLVLLLAALVPMVNAGDSQRISAGQDLIEANYIPLTLPGNKQQ